MYSRTAGPEDLGRLLGRARNFPARARCRTARSTTSSSRCWPTACPRTSSIRSTSIARSRSSTRSRSTSRCGGRPARNRRSCWSTRRRCSAPPGTGATTSPIKQGAPLKIEWNQGAIKESAFGIPKGAQGCLLGTEVPRARGRGQAAGHLRRHHRLSGPEPRRDEVHRRQADPVPADPARTTCRSSSGPISSGGTTTAPRWRSAGRGGCCRSERTRLADAGAAASGEPSCRSPSVVKRFGAVTALAGVDLEVRQGELLTLLGPSGSGKTTLLKVVAGFEMPDEGEVLLAGRDVTDAAAGEARHRHGVPELRAVPAHDGRRTTSPFRWRCGKVRRAEMRARVARGAAAGRPAGYGERLPRQLRAGSSSAWRWRARSCSSPDCCCSTSRSARSTASCASRCSSRCKRLQRRLGLTALFVTHDQEEALILSDRIAVMEQRADRAARHAAGDLCRSPSTASSPTSSASRTSIACASDAAARHGGRSRAGCASRCRTARRAAGRDRRC